MMPRKTIKIEYQGEVKSLSQWSVFLGVDYNRLKRHYNAGKSKKLTDAEIIESIDTDLNSGIRKQETYGKHRKV